MDKSLEQITEAYQLKCDELIIVIKELINLLNNISLNELLKLSREMTSFTREALNSLKKQGRI